MGRTGSHAVRLTGRAAGVLLAALAICQAAPARGGDGIVVVTAFAGDNKAAGLMAMAVVELQIWQTLRKPSANAPSKTAYYKTDSAPRSYEEAEAVARGSDVPLVVWGRAWDFRPGIAVQSYLSVVSEAEKPAPPLWTVRVPAAGRTISVGPPSLRYEFTPLVVKSEIGAKVGAFTELPVYADRGGGKQVGVLGDGFRAIKQEGDWAQISSGGHTGWVHLPGLNQDRSEAVLFTAGLIRILRADWEGALILLEPLVRNPKTRQGVRIDALLLMSASAAQQRVPDLARSISLADEARRLAPFSAAAARYACMARLAASAHRQAKPGVLLNEIDLLMADTQRLFRSGDPWVSSMAKLVDEAKHPNLSSAAGQSDPADEPGPSR
jgi:hypothetical protein